MAQTENGADYTRRSVSYEHSISTIACREEAVAP